MGDNTSVDEGNIDFAKLISGSERLSQSLINAGGEIWPGEVIDAEQH